jgi:hypothetical protein
MTLINDVVKVVPMLLLSVVAVGIALLFQALADATEVHGCEPQSEQSYTGGHAMGFGRRNPAGPS